MKKQRSLTVYSGGQTGVDQAALRAARACGLVTGGWAPYGYMTQDGIESELLSGFGLAECDQPGYPPRTRLNVKDSDATLILARNINSAGERCTLKAICDLRKPHLIIKQLTPTDPVGVAAWIQVRNIAILNVAGNSEHTARGIGAWAEEYLIKVFRHVQDLRLEGMGQEG